MAVYSEFITMAQRLISEFGQPCGWQKPAPATNNTNPYNPVVGPVPAPVPVRMVFLPPRTAAKYLQLMTGTEVPLVSEVALMAGGLSFSPELTDTIHRGSAVLAVKRINLVAPNGTPVLYYVEVSE